ncbi:aspartate aminotransferase family protein [Pseudomonas aeruginosa]|uniref:aspartate aminotransferase family protein n=1 Tax=Pseudomonas aeruginosa TaxID=287 RepID=UPI0026EEE556|nr:aspartate aminotransferase family protein [Pseudomonas aeruginosa]
MSVSGIAEHAVGSLADRERERFLAANPNSVALAERARRSLFGGVPMHWMNDWSTPVPLFVEEARGARFRDADGHDYSDFCLGDTGAMFGHSPAPIARALAEQAGRGLTSMLPGEDAVACGELLAKRFGLPFWQMATTASDANRFVLRWVRAITGRKIVLVFDGCYHGAVDETMVRGREGHTIHRAGLIGQARNLTQHTRVVPFNDLAALEAALDRQDIAAVLCEPAMTNIGMVLPEPGFLQQVREATRRHGSLLILDETHTLSTGPGGCTRAWNLEPDFLTLGKAVAGGVSCAVYGCTAEMTRAMRLVREHASEMIQGHGHSGMGTTLSGNALAMHCLRANLEEVASDAAYAHMLALAERLAEGLRGLFARLRLPWSVTQLGARCEFQFCAHPPKNGVEAEAAFHDSLEQALHLYLINRGILITPFHNMMLCAPQTTEEDVERLLRILGEGLEELLAIPGARA